MKNKNKIIFAMIFLIGIFLISCVSADYIRSTLEQFPFASSQSSESFDNSMCETGQDFLIQIAPFGCTPAVVRSDLLEEQNVPVYCQLGATQINPLVNVESIDSISFSGEYPPEISGVGFHPARAALGVEENLNSPVLNNIGYVVILLNEQSNASSMPDFVEGTLTAKLNYNAENVFGIGRAGFYLPVFNEEEWQNKYVQYSLWGGKAYLRAETIGDEEATISIYDSSLRKVSTGVLKKGESSGKIYITGFDCLAGLEIKLNDLKNPDTRVKFRIGDEVVEVSSGENFLENKCKLINLKEGFGESVTINCKTDTGSENFNLKVQPKIDLEFAGASEEGYEIGDWLYDTENSKAVYLGAVGTYGNTGKSEDLYAYLVETKKKVQLTEDDLDYVNDIVRNLEKKRPTGNVALDLFATIGKSSIAGGKLVEGFFAKGMLIDDLSYSSFSNKKEIQVSAVKNIFGKDVKISGFVISQDKELSPETKNYYQQAMKDYDAILESYSSEEYSNELTYGKKVLMQKINFANEMGQKETVTELCEDFEKTYSGIVKEIEENCENRYKLSSSEVASETILINGKPRKISFEGIYSPSLKDFSVDIFIKGAGAEYTGPRVLQKKDRVYLSDSEYISLKNLERDSAIFEVSGIDGWKENLVSSDAEIPLKDYKIVGKNNYQIRVDGINLKKTAEISVIPDIEHTESEVNFSFKIGIEKRGIEFSPEKTKKIINELNNTIEDWTEVSDVLGETVEGFKTACLATGALLTVKNFFANIDGKAIARQNIMRGAGGWYERCTDFVSAGSYDSIDACLFDNSREIEGGVSAWHESIQEQNNDIKNLQGQFIEKKFLSESVVNDEEFMKEYAPQVQEYLRKVLDESIEDPDGKAGSIATKKVVDSLSYENWKAGVYSLSQLRDVELYAKVLESNSDDKVARKSLYNLFAEIQGNSEEHFEMISLAEELAKKGLQNVRVRPFADDNTKVEVYDGAVVSGSFGGMVSGTPVQAITYERNNYILELSPLGDGNYDIKEVYDVAGKKVDESVKNKITGLYAYFKEYDRSSYENKFKSSLGESKPQVRYYESEPYKGLPAVVPFDLNNGWYAATKQTLPISGSIRAYDESGRVSSFWLCNVGANGIEEFTSVGDDICQVINTGTGQPYNQFAGLSEDEAVKRVEAGRKAIEQASKQYKSGVNSVSINVGYGNINLDVGSPAADIPDMQCADFMSPEDCKLLFNVCDPVICPSSRCDLGGAYPVKDVVQSGIIGSIALCLPNIKEGIVVPVCLSGLNAGLEGYLSVLTSYRDCMQESLNTGKQVGVCDEIHSVYLCEFFWRQAAPLSRIAIPKIAEAFLGQNTRGGGEYLGVQSAWENAENSLNYFTQSYGENAYSAFKARTAEDVGSEICKSYVSGVYLNGGDLISSLTEPDSPPQFHGRFDEIPFTSVTVPLTSQYKVFYHVYAGENTGAYYKVYLRGGSETSFYQDASSSRIVASGYISAGGYASETKDFTATSGYKEMCIMVNNQEPECGFQQVSTDFAVNYVADKYLEEQASQTQITTEKECISGSASVYNLLNPNVQEGVDNVINPEIYNRGIVRICATDNPGKGTDAYAGGETSRWMQVGYCDNEKIKCWIDRESIKNVIKNTEIEGEVLQEVAKSSLEILKNEGGYLGDSDFENLIKEIEDLIKEEKYEEAIDKVDESFEFIFWNQEKAEVIFLRGNVSETLALRNYREDTKDDGKISDEEVAKQKEDESAKAKKKSEEQSGGETSGNVEEKAEVIEEDISKENKACTEACIAYARDEKIGNCEIFGIGKSICSNNGYLLEGNFCGEGRSCCCSGEAEEEIKEEFFVDENYVSPWFNFKFWEMGVTDVNYRYFNGKWYWSFETEKWTGVNNFIDMDSKELPNRHKEIVKNLREKNYVEGIEVIAGALGEKTGLVKPEIIMRHGIIKRENVKDKGSQIVFNIFDYLGHEKLYFVYFSDEWFVGFGNFLSELYPVKKVNYDFQEHIALWNLEGKNYEKEIEFEETINLIMSLKNKGYSEGAVVICDTFYDENAEREGIVEEESNFLRGKIDENKFNELQKTIIVREKNCEYCNLFSNEECTEEVCEAIGVQIGEKCSYEVQKVFSNGEATQYVCVKVKWEKTSLPSQDYGLDSALEEIYNMILWYKEDLKSLDSNYELKQFLWDLYLNKVLTEKEYKDLGSWSFFNSPGTLRELKDILLSKKNSKVLSTESS